MEKEIREAKEKIYKKIKQIDDDFVLLRDKFTNDAAAQYYAGARDAYYELDDILSEILRKWLKQQESS